MFISFVHISLRSCSGQLYFLGTYNLWWFFCQNSKRKQLYTVRFYIILMSNCKCMNISNFLFSHIRVQPRVLQWTCMNTFLYFFLGLFYLPVSHFSTRTPLIFRANVLFYFNISNIVSSVIFETPYSITVFHDAGIRHESYGFWKYLRIFSTQVCEESYISEYFAETKEAGSVIKFLKCSDADPGYNGRLSYAITEGTKCN